MHAAPKQFPVLQNQRLLLRQLNTNDVPAWFARASDPESSRLSGDPIPESLEVCFEWLHAHLAAFAAGTSIRWAIEPKQLGYSIGSIGLSGLSPQTTTAEIGSVIGRQHWNQGFVTDAARLVIAYSQQQLNLTTIVADALATNGASKRVLEKLGFTFTHTIENYQQTPAGPLPGELFSLDLESVDC